jgi:cysteine desulfurase
MHSDAVQSFGKLVIDVSNGDFRRIDFVSISAHKIHGPKGIGALFAAAPTKLHPQIFGGGQENGIRSGTENLPGITGFGVAARIASADIVGHAKQANACRRRLLEGILAEIPDVQVNSPKDASVTCKPGCCSPYILNVSFFGARGEVILHELEKSGIYVSTGSACASLGKFGAKESGTYAAIGLSPEAVEGALRFSLSHLNTIGEIEFVVDRLKKAVDRFRRVGSFRYAPD